MSDLYARIVLFLIRPALRLHERTAGGIKVQVGADTLPGEFFDAARERNLLAPMPGELLSEIARPGQSWS